MESGDECLEELPRECVLCLHAVSCAFPLVLLEANDSLLLALYAMHVIMLFLQNNWLLSCVPVGFLSHDDLCGGVTTSKMMITEHIAYINAEIS